MKKEQVLDEWLVLRSQMGDTNALTLLAERWYPKLIRQIYWHIQDMDAAQDIAQETWYAIQKGIPKLKEVSRFGVWASRIAYNKAMDGLKKKQKQRNKETKLPEALESIQEVIDSKEDSIQLILRSIKFLPKDQRVVLSMFYLEEYSVRDIAKILQIPLGTVKSRLFHAREKLKSVLKKYTYE